MEPPCRRPRPAGVIVANRHNHRIQILTKEGKYLVEWRDFSRVSGLALDGSDTIYAADSESEPKRHPGWIKGIRIGSLKDGKVTIFVPLHKTDAPHGKGIAISEANPGPAGLVIEIIVSQQSSRCVCSPPVAS